MFGGGSSEERAPLNRSGSQPKPMYLAPRSNSISQVDVEQLTGSPPQQAPQHGGYQNGGGAGGFLASLWPFGGGGGRRGGGGGQGGGYQKIRKVPVKVEPKVFFSNERTFLAWLNMSVTLASISVAILAFADHNEFSQIYGFTVLPVAIAFVVYALRTYVRRSAMLRNRLPGPYEDRVGPVVLTCLLCLSILVNMCLKLVDVFSAKRTGATPHVLPTAKGGFKPHGSSTGPL